MWLYLIAIALVVLGMIGALAGGGIFTIVLVPLGLLMLASSIFHAMWARSQQGAAGGGQEGADRTDRPLPHEHQHAPARVPTSPEGLADARRAQQ
jgi:predicted lipid-binding transport protein (Tim44 family)